MTDLKSTLKVGDELARGHFGRVHIGSDGIRNELAVKVLLPVEGETDEKWKERKAALLKEGANLERASHRNIVAVHYLCEAANDDAVNLVMEFCHGGSLENAYRAGPMVPDEVLGIARDVCMGLASLHDRGMLHRDIKPGNILRDRNGLAKIGDFGFVTDEIIEGYAAGAGYLDHLAPEFYTDRVSSIRTDLWALGVTLYRLLHGHAWYEASDAPQFVIPEGGYAETLEWLPHIGKKWRRIIKSLLNDDPSKRPEHARALRRALADVDSCIWRCQIGETITWTKIANNRRHEVHLEKHNKRSYSWSAVSYPIGSGRPRTIGSGSKIGYRQAERELRQFFGQ